jgi:hypothetical protein
MPVPGLKAAWEIARGAGKYAGSVSNVVTGIPGAKWAVKHPLIAGPGLYYGGKFGKEHIGKPMYEAITDVDSPYRQMVMESKQRRLEQGVALRTRVQYEDIQRRMAKAAMRLAALDPHMYNEVMAGRSLPKDAVVFGGQPRTDLMEELAASMAQEQFKEPQSAHDELMESLGV